MSKNIDTKRGSSMFSVSRRRLLGRVGRLAMHRPYIAELNRNALLSVSTSSYSFSRILKFLGPISIIIQTIALAPHFPDTTCDGEIDRCIPARKLGYSAELRNFPNFRPGQVGWPSRCRSWRLLKFLVVNIIEETYILAAN
jgi:hypothetical protein